MDTRKPSLETLPEELICGINYFLESDRHAPGALAATSSQFFRIVQDERQRALVPKLLRYVAQGNQKEAEKILNIYPALLLKSGATTDYSGRHFKNVTAFQMALRAQDVEMWEMMERYFDRLPNGLDEKSRQFNEVFSSRLVEARSYDFSPLVKVMTESSDADIKAALEKRQNNTALYQALRIFRKEFTELSMKEEHFNPQHVIKAFTVYEEQFNLWKGDEQEKWHKRDLFWRQVVGFVLCFLPTCYAQAFKQGLCKIVENHEALDRSVDLKDGLLAFAVSSLLEEDAIIVPTEGFLASGAGRKIAQLLQQYVEQKHQGLKQLKRQVQNPAASPRQV